MKMTTTTDVGRSISTTTGHVLSKGIRLFVAVTDQDLAVVVVKEVIDDIATIEVTGPPRIHFEPHLETALGEMKRRSTWWHRDPPWGRSLWMVFGQAEVA